MVDMECAAEVCGIDAFGTAFRAVLRSSSVITLHNDAFPRTDANSPVICDDNEQVVFFSHYLPRGHSYRRTGAAAPLDLGDPLPVHMINDPDPASGKWLEAVWRQPDGDWFGWYHAEEPVESPLKSFCPYIGAVHSHDRGASWHFTGKPFRAPHALIDLGYDNGFFVGGYGDFCVVPDAAGKMLYLAYSSYVSDEAAQGIAIGRFPASAAARFPDGLELWSDGRWREALGRLATPLWPVRNGWKNSNPDSFWGPAIHDNDRLGAHVMLLNRTAHGSRNMVQEGVYISINRDISNPAAWSKPVQLVQGGGWYPQAISFVSGYGDTKSPGTARFFMGGYSAWTLEMEYSAPKSANQPNRPLRADRELFIRLFGEKHRPAW